MGERGIEQRGGSKEVGAGGGAQGVGERLGGEGADETVPAEKERREHSVHMLLGDRATELNERGQR